MKLRQRIPLVITLLLLLCASRMLAQTEKSGTILFYNVENLFDTRDDPHRNDNAFTPEGAKRWTHGRYIDKLISISRTITSADSLFPLFVGLCEVETRRVLEDLTQRTALRSAQYEILHTDSPDARGIDVALLYRRDYYTPITTRFIEVPAFRTRHILYSKGLFLTGDTLHLFVTHFPSMAGGKSRSDGKRLEVATLLRHTMDSIIRSVPSPYIVAMGDFNAVADDASQQRLRSVDPMHHNIVASASDTLLFNPGFYLNNSISTGSYRYRGRWQTLDHILVTGALFTGDDLSVIPRTELVTTDFSVERGARYGFRPRPTFRGRKYVGGVSDHFPVLIRLKW